MRDRSDIQNLVLSKRADMLRMDISIEIRVLQAYHVMNGSLAVKTGIDSYTNALMDSDHPNKQDLVVLRRLSFGTF